MKNRAVKKKLIVLLCTMIVILCTVGVTLSVLADDLSLGEKGTISTNISVTGTKTADDTSLGTSTVTVEGTKVTIDAQGYTESDNCGSTKNKTVKTTATLKNTNSDTTMYVDLVYTLASNATFGSFVNTSGSSTHDTSSGKVRLYPGDTISFTVTSSETSKLSGTVTLSSIKWAEKNSTVKVNLPDANRGTVKVNGSDVNAESGSYSNTAVNSTQYDLVATPTGTYKFHGWFDELSKTFVSYEASYTETFSDDVTLTPIFKDADAALFEVGANRYCFLDTAISAAASSTGKMVVLYSGGSAYHSSPASFGENSITFNVTDGVTLLLPYQRGSTAFSASDDWPYANADYYAAGGSILDPTKAWATLTLPENNILNFGTGANLIVGGKINTNAYNGLCAPYQTVACLDLKAGSQVNLGTNSVLSSCGYITGAGSINATASGIQIYQPITIFDWHGGNYANDAIDKNTFLFSLYSLRNIQANMTVGSDASMAGYIALDASSLGSFFGDDEVKCAAKLVGPDDAYLIQLSSGTVKLSYSPCNSINIGASGPNISGIGVTSFEISGNVALRSLQIETPYGSNIDSSKNHLPLPFTMNFHITGNSTITVESKTAVLPGCEIVVDEKATLISNAELIVLDGFTDPATANQYNYPHTASLVAAGISPVAELIINGTFTSNASFGGIVQTQSDSAKVTFANVSSVTFQHMAIATHSDSYVTHTLSPQLYLNGELVTLTSAGTFYSRANVENHKTSYSYKLYTSSSSYTTQTVEYDGLFLGEWYDYVVQYQNEDKTPVENGTFYFIGTGTVSNPPKLSDIVPRQIDGYLYAAIDWDSGTSGTMANGCTALFVLPAFSDTPTGIFAELQQKYRLNSYIWFNGIVIIDDSILALDTVKGKEFVVYAEDGQTVLTDIQAFEAGGTVYVVRKILSNEITSKISFRLQIDGVLTNVMTIDFESYNAGALSELKAAMLAYGAAADLFFDKEWKDDMEVAPFLESWNGMQKAIKNQEAPATDAYNGVLSVKTKGANFVFDESLMMKIRFQVGDVTDYTSQIVQIGVLVGDPAGILTTLEGEHTAAYVLYNKTAFSSSDASTPEGLPSDYVYSSGTNSVITDISALNFDEPLVVSFDLLSKEYTQNFGIRPYLVLNVGTDEEPQYVAVYGAQYTYGFDAYVYTMYHKSSDELTDSFDDAELNPDAFKNFLVYAWKYAEASAAANKES